MPSAMVTEAVPCSGCPAMRAEGDRGSDPTSDDEAGNPLEVWRDAVLKYQWAPPYCRRHKFLFVVDR